MDDDYLNRYSRHLLLSEIDFGGQQKISKASVLVVGAGGLGSSAIFYLAAMGVGKVSIIDGDVVESSNLQRQILHTENDIGKPKAESAKDSVEKLNAQIHCVAITEFISIRNARSLIQDADIVVDCSDNMTTRQLINEQCLKLQCPLVSASAIRFDGQLITFDFRVSGIPCFRCLYPDVSELSESCSESGVASPIVGIMGSFQALEVLKLITGSTVSDKGAVSDAELSIFDGKRNRWRYLKLGKKDGCPCCG